VDVQALVNQIANAWGAQPEMARLAARQARDTDTAARREAVVNAVQRLFPATGRTRSTDS
jgi:hypothetical protein